MSDTQVQFYVIADTAILSHQHSLFYCCNLNILLPEVTYIVSYVNGKDFQDCSHRCFSIVWSIIGISKEIVIQIHDIFYAAVGMYSLIG